MSTRCEMYCEKCKKSLITDTAKQMLESICELKIEKMLLAEHFEHNPECKAFYEERKVWRVTSPDPDYEDSYEISEEVNRSINEEFDIKPTFHPRYFNPYPISSSVDMVRREIAKKIAETIILIDKMNDSSNSRDYFLDQLAIDLRCALKEMDICTSEYIYECPFVCDMFINDLVEQ